MSRHVVGIDLGTTNSALAYALAADPGSVPEDAKASPIETLPIPQVVGVNDVSERLLLPSFLYLPASKEFPPGALDLPWKSPPDRVVGTFAREHGAKVPGRLVSSAKSWLVPPRSRPPQRHLALDRAGGRGQDLSRRRVDCLSRTPPRRLELPDRRQEGR